MNYQSETIYHIYVNNVCVEACVLEEELERHLNHIKGFLELTNIVKNATIDYIRCEPPNYGEASFWYQTGYDLKRFIIIKLLWLKDLL